MRSDIVPGDMVTIGAVDRPRPPLGSGIVFPMGIVISVVQANEVTDADIRGLTDLQPWSYYVMTSDPVKFLGPFVRHQLSDVG